MATPIGLPEQNDYATLKTGERYPVWVRDTQLGILTVSETISVWQLSDLELAQFRESKGMVFLTLIGGQPPVEVWNAVPVPFEGQNRVYTYPDCNDLPVYERVLVHLGYSVPEITSAWQLRPEQAQVAIRDGGIIYLRIIGPQPLVEVNAFNPIEL